MLDKDSDSLFFAEPCHHHWRYDVQQEEKGSANKETAI